MSDTALREELTLTVWTLAAMTKFKTAPLVDAILPIVDRLVAEQREKDATVADRVAVEFGTGPGQVAAYRIEALIRGGTSE